MIRFPDGAISRLSTRRVLMIEAALPLSRMARTGLPATSAETISVSPIAISADVQAKEPHTSPARARDVRGKPADEAPRRDAAARPRARSVRRCKVGRAEGREK